MRPMLVLVLGLLLASLHAAHGQWRGEAAPVGVAATRERPLLPDTLPPLPPFRGGAVTLGAAAGGMAGMFAGAMVGGGLASTGNPDCEGPDQSGCFWTSLPGLLYGAGLGYAVGAPVGAHLANGRRGTLGRSLLISTALFGIGAVGLRSRGEDFAPVAIVALPLAQIINAVTQEQQSAAERSRRPTHVQEPAGG